MGQNLIDEEPIPDMLKGVGENRMELLKEAGVDTIQ